MAQQTNMTAVEWLQENCFDTYLDGKIYCNGKEVTDEIEQAKQMEKEQIINDYIAGQCAVQNFGTYYQAEQYYNETYGKNQSNTEKS